MIFMIDCSSLAGLMIRVSMSWSSGETSSIMSIIACSYFVTLRMVCAESGCFPMRSYSPEMGDRTTDIWFAYPELASKRSGRTWRGEACKWDTTIIRRGRDEMKSDKGQSRVRWLRTRYGLTKRFGIFDELLCGLLELGEMAMVFVKLCIIGFCIPENFR